MADELIIFVCISLGVLIRFLLPYIRKIIDGKLTFSDIMNGKRYIGTSVFTEFIGLVLFLFTDFISKLSELPSSVDIFVYVFALGFGIGGNDFINNIEKYLVQFGLIKPTSTSIKPISPTPPPSDDN
ncbi:MAG: hypothetical protein ACXAC7_22190 [Candidatus Hodarchaeales archaeon]|jgi:hypothetical protein